MWVLQSNFLHTPLLGTSCVLHHITPFPVYCLISVCVLSNSVHFLGSRGFHLIFLEMSSALHHGICVFCTVIMASYVILFMKGQCGTIVLLLPQSTCKWPVSPSITCCSHWALHPLAIQRNKNKGNYETENFFLREDAAVVRIPNWELLVRPFPHFRPQSLLLRICWNEMHRPFALMIFVEEHSTVFQSCYDFCGELVSGILLQGWMSQCLASQSCRAPQVTDFGRR